MTADEIATLAADAQIEHPHYSPRSAAALWCIRSAGISPDDPRIDEVAAAVAGMRGDPPHAVWHTITADAREGSGIERVMWRARCRGCGWAAAVEHRHRTAAVAHGHRAHPTAPPDVGACS